jgi:organic radical activating enzyme
MYGLNPVRKQELDPDGKLWVQEIFSTLQGEGSHAGTPSIFVRLAGCNLTCDFCDTQFESAFESADNFMTVPQISTVINRMSSDDPGCTNIVITGGEPFRQNFVPLVNHLLSLGFTIEIETAGTLWIDTFHFISKDCHVTVSPKTPKINASIETVASAYKYIVGEDNCPKGSCLVPLSANGKELPMPKYRQPIFIQPMDDANIEKAKANIRASIGLVKQTGWRLSVQTHKMLGIE